MKMMAVAALLCVAMISCDFGPDLVAPTAKRIDVIGGGGGGSVAEEVEWYWTAPTTGTEAINYFYELEADSVVILDGYTGNSTRQKLILKYGSTYKFRVAGIDSLGRMGDFSLWSEGYDLTGGKNEVDK